MSGTDHTRQRPARPSPVIVLVEPQLGENIGTAARAMANFALQELRIVKPRDGWPSAPARKAASGADQVIDDALLYDSCSEAVGDLNYVYATTARPRGMVKSVITPEEAGIDIGARLALGQKVGILFGRERFGLRNEEVALADVIVMAPVDPAFASLNVAQAVLLMGYEWFKRSATSIGQATPQEPAYAGSHVPLGGSQPATKEELEGFFAQLKKELVDCGFLRPPEKAPSMMRNIRSLFLRAALTEQEVRTLRGIVSGLTYTHLRDQPGDGIGR
ncbi:MAG: RNA methyltransferase [Pseudomonadota bacterium]|nr:RNA methyltransferase [Pseudomonadota bacterium]